MPFGSYQTDEREGVANAVRFVKEAGAEAVKLEGGRERKDLVRRVIDAQIPVMGHLGLTPQSVHRMGGYKVQGKTIEAIDELRTDALALQDAGCFALVLEGVPRELARIVTEELMIPTIGIGAGPDCDGQILVLHDMMSNDVFASCKVRATVRRCGGSDAKGIGRVSRRRRGKDLSIGRGELPSLARDAGVNGCSDRSGGISRRNLSTERAFTGSFVSIVALSGNDD